MSIVQPIAATTAPVAAGQTRPVAGIYSTPGFHWVGDGFRVAGYFSSIPDGMRKMDPFLVLDYHPTYTYAPTERPRGIGSHPHRGIETVTLAWQGSVAHHDSTGSGGVIGPGDAQWMTAASGILHREYHEANWARAGGPFQMAQLWVNLPKAHKMDAPRYQTLRAAQLGVVTLPANGGSVRILAGEFQGMQGPARTMTPMNVFDVRLNAGGQVEFTLPAAWNLGLLVMQGDITISGQEQAQMDDFVLFRNEGERVAITAGAAAHLLVLSGEPINEPIVARGPFVMNTREEIDQAYADYRSGKFGSIKDDER